MAFTTLLLLFQAWHTGVTTDEPSHLVSARLYWQHADRLRPQDMPPLIKIAGGWVPSRLNLPLPADLGKPGEDRREWEVAIDMMQRLQPSAIHDIYFKSRLPFLVFPLLTLILLWTWAGQLFSKTTALVIAAAFALEPTALAHGALFKNDLAATFTYLLFWFCAWRYAESPSVRRALAVGGAAALAMLTKLSLLFVIPLAPVLIVLCAKRGQRIKALAWSAGAVVLIYVTIAAAYQFDLRPLTVAEFEAAGSAGYVPRWFIAVAGLFRVLPIPTSLWTGLITLFSNTSFSVPVYMLGRVWPEGNPFYFLFALAVKVPVSIWILMLGGAAITLRRRPRWTDLLWLLPGILYIALASSVPLQLGVRLVLPALPFGLLLAGRAIEALQRTQARQAMLAVLAAVFLFETIRSYPNGITFFNLAAGGPANGSRLLLDSNLDWGQGLPELETWARTNKVLPIRLSYFGNDMPFRYFRGNEVELLAPPWAESLVKSDQLIPEPGVWYAISPTLIPGQFFAPRFQDYYARFRSLKPVAMPGHSIFVYRVDLQSK